MRRIAWTLLMLPFAAGPLLAGDPAMDALHRLNARLPKSSAAAEWRNISSQPDSELERLRDALAALRSRPADGGTALRVTLSESASSLLLAAEADTKVWIESWPRPAPSADPHLARLVRDVLLLHPRPMLDAVRHSSGKWIVLEPRALLVGDRVFPLPVPRPLPRDTRGWLQIVDDRIVVMLPGTRCESDLESVTCSASAPGEGIVAGRNYFEDRLGRYYSAAVLQTVAIRTGLDGKLHAFAGDRELAAADGWGELVARVDSTCGVSALAVRGASDLVAIEWPGGPAPRDVTPPLAAGVVTAIWTAADGKSATVISRRAESGEYEASQVSVACNR